MERAKNQKPLVDKLAQLSAKLKPFLSDSGLSKLSNDQADLSEKWQNVKDEAELKLTALAETETKVKQFWTEFNTLEKSVGTTPGKLNRAPKFNQGKALSNSASVEVRLAAAQVYF